MFHWVSNRSYHLKRGQFLRRFFNCSDHQWIKENSFLQRVFEDFFTNLPEDILLFLAKNKVLFLKTNGKYSCAVNLPRHHQAIIVFPELYQLLNSAAPDYGLAILAHEIGHLWAKHSTKKIDPLEAQIEADRFALDLGHGRELAEILEEQPKSKDMMVRLVYLTSALAKDLDKRTASL